MIVANVNTNPNTKHSRSMMVIAFRRDALSCIPQNREVSTEAPIPMPMQQIWKILIN